MKESVDDIVELPRIATGMPPFDAVLYGGLLAGGLYLLIGEPGVGKTIMTNQIAYHHARTGGQVVYMTVLGETHSRLLAHLRQFQFFDAAQIGTHISYISGYGDFRAAGLTGLGQLVSSTMIQHQLGLLVLDGMPLDLQTPGSPSAMEMNDFLHGLQAACETARCTVIITTPSTLRARESHALLLVDGVIHLQRTVTNTVELRTLDVRKFRGSAHRAGLQPFTITSAGITPIV